MAPACGGLLPLNHWLVFQCVAPVASCMPVAQLEWCMLQRAGRQQAKPARQQATTCLPVCGPLHVSGPHHRLLLAMGTIDALQD
jgi:hypothetical protein